VSEGRTPYERNRRIDRFKFTSIREIEELKRRVDESPDLKRRLKENFLETLEDEGLDVDDLKGRVVEIWQEQMRKDLREKMSELPENKKKYYGKISEGKSLKLRVRIDRETGGKTVSLREDS
jgi:hypothetical protein